MNKGARSPKISTVSPASMVKIHETWKIILDNQRKINVNRSIAKVTYYYIQIQIYKAAKRTLMHSGRGNCSGFQNTNCKKHAHCNIWNVGFGSDNK